MCNLFPDSTSKWQKEGAIAIWLQIPIMLGSLIPIAASQGYELHHTEGDHIYLSRWLLDCPSRLPPYANHQIGVSGIHLVCMFAFNFRKMASSHLTYQLKI